VVVGMSNPTAPAETEYTHKFDSVQLLRTFEEVLIMERRHIQSDYDSGDAEDARGVLIPDLLDRTQRLRNGTVARAERDEIRSDACEPELSFHGGAEVALAIGVLMKMAKMVVDKPAREFPGEHDAKSVQRALLGLAADLERLHPSDDLMSDISFEPPAGEP